MNIAALKSIAQLLNITLEQAKGSEIWDLKHETVNADHVTELPEGFDPDFQEGTLSLNGLKEAPVFTRSVAALNLNGVERIPENWKINASELTMENLQRIPQGCQISAFGLFLPRVVEIASDFNPSCETLELPSVTALPSDTRLTEAEVIYLDKLQRLPETADFGQAQVHLNSVASLEGNTYVKASKLYLLRVRELPDHFRAHPDTQLIAPDLDYEVYYCGNRVWVHRGNNLYESRKRKSWE